MRKCFCFLVLFLCGTGNMLVTGKETVQLTTRLSEILNVVEQESLYSTNPNKVFQNFIDTYLESYDIYAHYFPPKDFLLYKKSLEPEYSGIQMEIVPSKSGGFLCFPYPGGLAEHSGIKQGDLLVAVDGESVSEKNLYTVGSMIRGLTGAPLTLSVQPQNGSVHQITLVRRKSVAQSVKNIFCGSYKIYRIIRFTDSTPLELKKILLTIPIQQPLILDLRGNFGGVLFSAIKSSELFLPKDVMIAGIRTKDDFIAYHSKNQNPLLFKSIIILQDEQTASAAELFIAALIQNKAAISFGKKTYGKGVTQKFIELANGSALLLTYGKIVTPNNTTFNKKGLMPTISRTKNEQNDSTENNLIAFLDKLFSTTY